MKELHEIVAAWRALAASETAVQTQAAVLATVVKVEGSSYRRAGARMLILPDGRHVGSISGGCLERHVVERAWWLTERDGAVVCRYDTSADEDAQWAFGLGCNGVVHVLLERLYDARTAQMALLGEVLDGMQAVAMAVVIASGGRQESGADVPRVGERLLCAADGGICGDWADAELQARVTADLALTLQAQCSRYRRYAVAGAHIEVWLEVVSPPQRLLVFGAGHDAVPLVQLAHGLGWHVTVADGRAHYVRRERFPEADRVVLAPADDPLRHCAPDAGTAVVVMTHSVEQDRAVLARLLPDPPRYVGQLGPRVRTERMLCEIRQASAGVVLQTERLHYPVGLDIGADNPQEIALAIVAEIRAVLAGRSGVALHGRPGTIHERTGVLAE